MPRSGLFGALLTTFGLLVVVGTWRVLVADRAEGIVAPNERLIHATFFKLPYYPSDVCWTATAPCGYDAAVAYGGLSGGRLRRESLSNR